MKVVIISLFGLVLSAASFCQDTVKMRQIDSLVKVINQSKEGIKYDSILQDYKELGLTMRTYLTSIANGKDLKKFSNKVYTRRDVKGVTEESVSENAFYFDQKKLIKVEEYITKGDKTMHADWYYHDGKPLYYTMQSDKAESRATLLLEMAKTFLEKFQE